MSETVLESEIIALVKNNLVMAISWAGGKKSPEVEAIASSLNMSFDQYCRHEMVDCIKVVFAIHELTQANDVLSKDAIDQLNVIYNQACAIKYQTDEK